MNQPHYGLNALIYSPPKIGKTWFGASTPPPRLILDSEAGSRFIPGTKISWNPSTENPPEADGKWDSAIVSVRQFRDVTRAYEWLNSGQHPFRSVVLDSISEIQQRAVDDIAGTNQLKQQDWGQLLRMCSDVIRKFRDLITNPVRPLDAVIYIAMAKTRNDGTVYPYVQGSLATVLPYFLDVVGYLDYAPQEDGTMVRRLYIGPLPGYETGERVGGRLGRFVDIPDNDLTTATRMVQLVRGNGKAYEYTQMALQSPVE